MKKVILITLVFAAGIVTPKIFTQNITNTLGNTGIFTIKDNSNAFFTLKQSNGEVFISKSLKLANTTNSTSGVIYKNNEYFLHNYTPTGLLGKNLFMGLSSGNFTITANYGNEGSFNTGLGNYTLEALTTGYENTAVGSQSLTSNTTGYENTGIGVFCLSYNTTGKENTAVGYASLSNNISGEYNTALGSNSLSGNHGNSNTGVGVYTLYFNDNGYNNTGIGSYSLYSNTNGYGNTGTGSYSLYSNTTGNGNIGIGENSLYANTIGFGNTGIGGSSLSNNISGVQNTAVGLNSGSNVTTGNNLILIGYNAQPTTGSTTNQITLGNNQITSLRCNVTTITSLSDMRDKKNISDLSLGLDFIMKIQPRQFNWDKREWYKGNISDGSKMQLTSTAGFIAQELDEVQKIENAEWLNLVLKDNPEKWEATPGNLLPVAIKSIQELKIENDRLRSEIESLKLASEKLSALETAVKELQNKLEKLSGISGK